MTDPDMTDVEAALSDAAQIAPDVPDGLMAAVLRDAARLQPGPALAVSPTQGVWHTFLDLIGGWPAMGGLAAAGVAGVWLGIAPPIGLEAATAQLLGTTQTIDLFGTDSLSGFDLTEAVQ